MKNKAWISIPLTTTFAESEPLVQKFLTQELPALKVEVAVFVAEYLRQRSIAFSVEARSVTKDTASIVRINMASETRVRVLREPLPLSRDYNEGEATIQDSSSPELNRALRTVLRGTKYEIPASHLRLSNGASVWTDDPDGDFCVIWREGAPMQFQWFRSTRLSLTEANDACAEKQVSTRAFVAKYAESMAIGLPETFE